MRRHYHIIDAIAATDTLIFAAAASRFDDAAP